MERQHADFWLALAEGYHHLKVAYTNSSSGVFESASVDCGDGSESEMEKWTVTEELGHILHNTVSLFRPYFSWRTVTCTHSISHSSKPNGTKTEKTHNTIRKEGSAYNHDCTQSDDHLKMGLFICHKDCPFFNFSQSHKVLSDNYCYSALVTESGATKLTLCLLHSPFVMLASRQVTVKEFCELLKSLTRSKAVDVWCNICTLAECSCYLWAR